MFSRINTVIITVLLAPILLVQGVFVKRVTPKLPEASGKRVGSTGNGEKLSLLIMGDSAAAGVGVDSIEQSLMGYTVEGLASEYTIDWRLHAKTGVTTGESLEELKVLENKSYNVVITSLGVNDVTHGVSLKTWLFNQSTLFDYLRNAHHSRCIIVSALPPMADFPALPQPLRWYLGRRAKQFNHALQQLVEKEKYCYFLAPDFIQNPEHMASDGFHPGEMVYQQWADFAVAKIKHYV